MLTNTAGTVQVTSSLEAPDATMSLDPTGMAHIMGVLTNLYSDKDLAVLREYSTNALDSHVAAGNPDPIQVTLPTQLNPTLVISDHGVGLSKDELLGIYSRYGASSKRDTNTQVGSFGLGSKSAFTIGGQFVVTARKSGYQTSAVFALDTHGVGTVNILAEHETSEPNGVTVSIAIPEPGKMREVAGRFFQGWRPGTVLVDGEEPTNFFSDPESLWLGDDILVQSRGGITVVMGSVAYPLPSSAVYTVRDRCKANWPTYGTQAPGLLVTVPIGAVDITPSREGIRDTERSIAAISAALKPLQERLTAKITQAGASAPDEISRVFAMRKMIRVAERLNVKVSHVLPKRIDLGEKEVTQFFLTSRGGLRTEDLNAINAETVHLLTVLVGVPENRSAKRHAKQWVEDQQRTQQRTLIMVGNGNATEGTVDWFRYGGDSPVSTVHFDDIELPAREYTASQRNAITYRTSAGYMTPSEIKAQSLPVAYGRPVSPATDGYLVVQLNGRQSQDVFLRRVPGAVPTQPIVHAYTQAQLKALGDLQTLGKGYHLSETLGSLKYRVGGKTLAQITHPAYLQAVKAAEAFKALSVAQQGLVRLNNPADSDDARAELFGALPLLELTLQGYRELSAAAKAHIITYCNTAPVL